jgi:ferritin-like metal-binding protein YciE
MESLEELLHEELRDIYDAEKQLTKALPKMMKNAANEELRDAFEEHLRQTEQHVKRLERVFSQLGEKPRAKRCEGMKHLIAEGEDMISDVDDDATCDALLIAAAQKVEHYEMAAYGTLRTWANLVGRRDAAALLEDTLEEEKETDQKLTTLAESFINQMAAEGDEEEEGQRGGRTARGRSASRFSTTSRSRQAAADRSKGRSRRR